MTADTTRQTCMACPRTFRPRTDGAKPKVYHGPECRHRHRHRKARTAFTPALEAAGVVTIAEVMAALDDPRSPCKPHLGTKPCTPNEKAGPVKPPGTKVRNVKTCELGRRA